MIEKNNPAGKMLELMKRAQTIQAQATMIDLWSTLLGCDPANTADIVSGVARIMALNAEAMDATKSYAPGNPEKFLAPFVRIERLLNEHHLAKSWSNYSGYLDAGTMTALEFVDHFLEITFAEPYPGPPKNVRDFIVSLDELLNEFLESELSADLKDLFIKNLEALRQALIRYRVGGEAAVEEALDKVTGSLIRHQDDIKAEFDLAKEFLDKASAFMDKINELVAKSQTAVALASPVTQVLLQFFK